MKQNYVGVRMTRVRGRRLPNKILDDISAAIKTILERRQNRHCFPQKKEVVVINAAVSHGGQTAIVATRFSYSHKKRRHGFLFHVFLYLRDVVRRVAGYCAKIPFDTLKVSFAVEPTIGELAHN